MKKIFPISKKMFKDSFYATVVLISISFLKYIIWTTFKEHKTFAKFWQLGFLF